MDARTNINPVFPALDGIRALAVSLVFVSHAVTGHFLTEHANLGVTLFFVLSGFLLYRPFVVGRNTAAAPSVGRYFRRRALRILPAYWLALTVILALTAFPENTWRTYLLLQTYSPHTIFEGIPGAWSLCVEATFYIALPVYAALVARARLALRSELVLLVGLTVASVGFRELVGPGDVWAYATLPGTLAWFAAGMALARLSVDTPSVIARASPTALWILALLLYLLVSVLQPPAGLFDPLDRTHVPTHEDATIYLLGTTFAACAVMAALSPLVIP